MTSVFLKNQKLGYMFSSFVCVLILTIESRVTHAEYGGQPYQGSNNKRLRKQEFKAAIKHLPPQII